MKNVLNELGVSVRARQKFNYRQIKNKTRQNSERTMYGINELIFFLLCFLVIKMWNKTKPIRYSNAHSISYFALKLIHSLLRNSNDFWFCRRIGWCSMCTWKSERNCLLNKILIQEIDTKFTTGKLFTEWKKMPPSHSRHTSTHWRCGNL